MVFCMFTANRDTAKTLSCWCQIIHQDYLDYLKERNYDYIVAGTDHVDYRLALEELNRRYSIKTVITDTGGVLASILLEGGLVDEVQLLISPEIVGKKAVNLFRSLNQPVKLQLTRNKIVGKNHALLIYKVQIPEQATKST